MDQELLKNLLATGQITAEAYKQLLANIEPASNYQAQNSGDGAAIAMGENSVAVASGATYIGGIYQGKSTDDELEALNIYREGVLYECGRLSISGLDLRADNPTNRDNPLQLTNVYVTLNTTQKQSIAHGSQEDDSEEDIPITALGMCGSRQRLVLLGDPGGGKSTFVNHLAYSLAALQLNQPGNWRGQLTPEYNSLTAEQLTLLPVKIILRDFAADLPKSLPKKNSAPLQHLTQFIQKQFEAQNLSFVTPHLEKALQSGRVWFLFDGLDEVTQTAERLFVRDAVEAFAVRYPQCHVLVTCRVLSYQDKQYQLDESRFSTAELDQFDETQRDSFIAGWYGELVTNGRMNQNTAETMTNKLQQSIRRPDLWRLAGNPLLLTVMALVHTHKRRLPEGRAQLYHETVQMLLWRWEEIKLEGDDLPALRLLLEEVGRTDLELHSALSQIAYKVHKHSDENNLDEVADVSRQEIYDALQALSPDHGWAQRVIEVMRMRTGLLVERQPNMFTFPHRTFQEYLAGVHLANSHDEKKQPNFPQQAKRYGEEPQWRTAILLAAGYLTHVKLEPFRVLASLGELCPETIPPTVNGVSTDPRHWHKAWLAGEMVLEIGLTRVRGTDYGRQLLKRIQSRLARIITEGVLEKRERIEVGMLIAKIGDPRPGVGVKEGLPDILWGKEISVGDYWIGGDNTAHNSLKHQQVPITQAYQLSCYLVTHSQFQAFLNDKGIENDIWWKGILDKYRVIRNQRWPITNHPRESINWYQAVAFCRWLTAQFDGKYLIRLPHEYEWEVAARFNDYRIYPWGNDPNPQKGNTNENGLDKTVTVGLYYDGCQPNLNLYDMSGNVWEWCLNKYGRPNDVSMDVTGAKRVLRGGSWKHLEHLSRAASRTHGNSSYALNYNVGFRLCRVRTSSHL